MRSNYDAVVLGGSLGGVLAAYSLAKRGHTVVLLNEYDWIGGQLTSQGVPSDEHRYIEQFGCTKTYKDYRNKVREYYRNHPYIKDEYKNMEVFNPGGAWVSVIAHEPRVALHILNDMLLPFVNKGILKIINNTKIIDAICENDVVKEIKVLNKITNELNQISADYFLDATDTGELLPLTNTDYVTGSEGSIYNEPHATIDVIPSDMQPITWVAALSYEKGGDNVIEKPKEYDYFRNYIAPFSKDVSILSWFGPHLDSYEGKKKFKLFGRWVDEFKNQEPPMFSYRQIVDSNKFKDDFIKEDVTLLNWPQNDFFMNNIFECDNEEHQKYMAKQLTLSFVYWLQTEATRHDSKELGYNELKLRGDVLGTKDGLAQAPYIRESRRIKALYTVVEQDISIDSNEKLPHFWDSIGVGLYHIDLHMTTVTNSYFYQKTWPFEIPLGSLIPIKTKNLIASCKNIGTTHITNGCYRLHPTEWNIGESAGILAAYCIENNLTPKELYKDRSIVKEFQALLEENGIELKWPEDKVSI